jgi:hypothetical protein
MSSDGRRRFFDAGETPGESSSALTRDIAGILTALGLETSAVHASVLKADASPNDFLLALRVRDQGEGLMLTLRVGARLPPSDRPLDARVLRVDGPDGEPVQLLIFPDATVSVRRDH